MTYIIQYGLTGFVNHIADETTLHDPLEERFATLREAIARGRELVKQLGPGGRIYIGEDMDWSQGVPNPDDYADIAHVSRGVETGEWWVSPYGIDLR